MRQFCALLTLATWAIAAIADGAIVRWDTREVIPGTENITLGPGVQIDHRELEFADLRLVDLTDATLEQSNLTSADFYATRLDNANLRGANLTRARLYGAVLFGTDLTDAMIEGAGLGGAVSNGLTREQIYSTASYKSRQLSGIDLGVNVLSDWDLSQQNLSGSSFAFAWLIGIDFSRANLTNGNFREARVDRTNFRQANLTGASFNTPLFGSDFTDAIVAGASLYMTFDQLASTASYKQKELPGVTLSGDLRGWNLSGQNLTGAHLDRQLDGAVFAAANLTNATMDEASLVGANFHNANLTGANLVISNLHFANFTNALIFRARLTSAAFRGFTPEQMYSTASYKQKQLTGINLENNILNGWNFSGQDLSGSFLSSSVLDSVGLAGANLNGAFAISTKLRNADLTGASFVGTDLTRSDLRSAVGFGPDSTTIMTNTIWPDGTIRDLNLSSGFFIEISDYNMPITITDRFEVVSAGIALHLQDGEWGSTIVTRDDAPILSNASLGISYFTTTPTLYSLEGTTFDLFDWGQPPAPGNRFATVHTPPGTTWDLSRLYDTGEVTLLTVPEPGSWLLLMVACLSAVAIHIRNRASRSIA